MKVGKSMLAFEPRQWKKPDRPSQTTNPLEAEHPTCIRVVEGMCVATDLGLQYAQAPQARQATAGLGALTAAGLAVWGVNKWRHGETGLDRVEAVGSLSLSLGYGVQSAGLVTPLGSVAQAVSDAAIYAYAGTNLLLGGVDTVRGVKEKTPDRLVSGLAQVATGVCVAGMQLFPGASGPLLWTMLGSIAARQLAVGLPGEPLS